LAQKLFNVKASGHVWVARQIFDGSDRFHPPHVSEVQQFSARMGYLSVPISFS
jgi:hypothetical protein